MSTPKYPGLGLPLTHFPQDYNAEICPTGIHSNCFGSYSDLLPVREVAMMAIMDKLTDKENWHSKIMDEEIVAKWRNEALEYPDNLLWKLATGDKEHTHYDHLLPVKQIITNVTFDYCVQELQSKARYYKKSGLIPTLDACASVVKSDSIISSEFRDDLRTAFDVLKADQAASPDWHPNSDNMVQDLVHPSMYPLVYGRSRVMKEEAVGISDAIHTWAGKGEVIAKGNLDGPAHTITPPPHFWSDTYQWLPSNVAFKPDGRVKLTSYINNLHPDKYPEIYHTIENLIEKSIPAWDQCLGQSIRYGMPTGAGRFSSRFSTPAHPDDENEDNWAGRMPGAKSDSESGESYDPEEEVDFQTENDFEDLSEHESEDEAEMDDEEAQEAWRMNRVPVQPQPENFSPADDFYDPKAGQRLSEKFKEPGLQIIVKMASIELTPEKPQFPAGGWHVEGQMNERISATALYYLDSENITPSSLSFRMQTSSDMQETFSVGQDSYNWIERVYGTTLGHGSSPCLQNYGSVDTREGRLLAFPNVFQHRVSPFHLTDPTKPGHRRFIALWLVDPHTRIISTANVPPQQQDWWVDAIFSQSGDTKKPATSKLSVDLANILDAKAIVAETAAENREGKLPLEIVEMVKEYFDVDGDRLPMTGVEAREHREALMGVRGAFRGHAIDEWYEQTYNFCEH